MAEGEIGVRDARENGERARRGKKGRRLTQIGDNYIRGPRETTRHNSGTVARRRVLKSCRNFVPATLMHIHESRAGDRMCGMQTRARRRYACMRYRISAGRPRPPVRPACRACCVNALHMIRLLRSRLLHRCVRRVDVPTPCTLTIR